MNLNPQTGGPRTAAPRSRKVFFVAGEVSGDIQTAHLIEELRRRDPHVELMGVGGSRMAAAGMSVVLDSTQWGVIGHAASLLRAPGLLRALHAVAAAVRRIRPQVLVLVDFPGFNLRLAQILRTEVPILYYFPPMVSVRLGNRAASIAALGMRLLTVFPFEEAAYRAAGANEVFIGHPAVDTVRPRHDAAVRRARLGLTEQVPVVGLLPGSRPQEIAAHLPVMVAAATTLGRMHRDLQFVLPVPADHLRPHVDRVLDASPLPVHVTGDVYDAMAECTVLMATSGSVTLEAALLGVPMVVVYRLSALSWQIALRITFTRHASLPNLLAGREIVPELLQSAFTARNLTAQVDHLLTSAPRRAEMAADLHRAVSRLGPPGATARAAGELLSMLDAYDKMETP
ncbi:MAG TPA: lipid-A-disaccharide synthase [bacterium]|jgi:lipid-A-disaccharide synthase